MLDQLLNMLFSNKTDPDQAIKRRLEEHWEPLLKPISPQRPVGDDPTYNDDFMDLKEEIGKLSGINYAAIIKNSEAILEYSSKDIRVATYYCFARLQQDGAEGFADGVELIAGLLDRFGAELYPSRNTIRRNSIEWIASAKFTEPLSQSQPIPEAIASRILAAVNLIEQANQRIFLDGELTDKNREELPDLTGIIRLFASNITQPKAAPVAPKVVPKSEDKAKHESVNVESAEIRSQRDLLDQARRMAVFLREKPDGYLAAGRLLRTVRWDTINALPPIDNRGRSRLPAPRAELRQNISRLAISQQWNELFERVEAAFVEGANHFWFDLQRYAVLALQKMGGYHAQWADIFLTDIGLMLERFKGVERLQFENGTPFADDETLNWIALSATIHHIDNEAIIEPITVSGDNDWHEIELQARELAQKEGLEVAFSWLQGLPDMVMPKQRFLLQYTQARVAEHLGKIDVALRLLQGVNIQQKNIEFAAWEPALLFDIKANLLKLLKLRSQLKEGAVIDLSAQIEILNNELIQLDPARALTVIK